ncbi:MULTISPECIES: N-acetyl-gamma-glutamyl-phosphate reductase [Sphingomonas]|uniref:N-acetyl-gamma-glutamyl-phosphate reductase n=1 Tax=Sphingomonas TaxID=13687 RepID=UPI000F7DC1CB|nr:N-acetyl-gamma-glutamyl-phosphate reductase [Sphingomonas sp. ABOLF]RSV17064.1 N-acetyl-gamma-glutamyl-phosphate reductase [Sphingomonas sp. ABOLF]GLK21776.1 N-acetyl-gamma-glutamyl-phosphate reductase [Microbacterium terregens]
MTATIFIDGAAGTTGLEIRERLAGRPEISLVTLDDSRRKDPAARREALNDADFVILCLPDDAAREAVSLIENDRTRVIDASTAHRTSEGWVYGMAELEPAQPALIAEAARVANPGCYPTGFLALVRPLVRAGLIPHDWPVSVNAVSGFSGGGRSMIEEYQQPNPPAFRAYAMALGHKHVAEMQRHARLAHPPIFTPAVANTYRGMVVEVPLPLHAMTPRPTLPAIEGALQDAYRGSPVVRVGSAEAPTVSIEENAGSDRLTVRVFGNAVTGQLRLVATLDNLGKGAAGAAVQNLNIMAGFDPAAGLVL